MRLDEKNGTHRDHPKRNTLRANAKRIPSLNDVFLMGRRLPRKVRRDLQAHPQATLAILGGASFLAGAIFGSRLGRTLLSVAIPFGVQRLLETEVGPRLRTYVDEWLHALSGNDVT
jgi:hypothetical protein